MESVNTGRFISAFINLTKTILLSLKFDDIKNCYSEMIGTATDFTSTGQV
jgi:hypothetical protein